MMNFWSPGPSIARDDTEVLPPFNRSAGFLAPYDASAPVLADLSTYQDSLPTNPFFSTFVGTEDIKIEPDWEACSNSTPDSANTQPSHRLTAASTATRRSAKNRRNTSTSTESMGSSIGPSSELSREKNRVAASKCRRKKKAEEHHLEERRRMLQVQHAILQDNATALKNEVLHLKNEILKHGSCNYPPIQKYIEVAASKLR